MVKYRIICRSPSEWVVERGITEFINGNPYVQYTSWWSARREPFFTEAAAEGWIDQQVANAKFVKEHPPREYP